MCYLLTQIPKILADLRLLNEPENLRICNLQTLKRSLLAHLCKLIYGYQVSLVECPHEYNLLIEDCCSTNSRNIFSPQQRWTCKSFFKPANKKIRKFLGSFLYRKSSNFLGAAVHKSQICINPKIANLQFSTKYSKRHLVETIF
jgi:hypothetical protein